jgi:hypothetical protein
MRHPFLLLATLFALSIQAEALPKECAFATTAPTLVSAIPVPTVSGSLLPDDEIDSIQVQFDTGSGIFSGDTDDVWLDIGPRAWKVGDSFDAGTIKTVTLSSGNINDAYFELSAPGKLRVRDIAYIRIEKKGICGLTDAPDSLLDLVFPGGATPANLLPSARAEIEKAQTELARVSSLLDLHAKAIEAEQKTINSLAGDLNHLQDQKTSLEKSALDLNTAILQKQHDLDSGVIQKTESFVETYMKKICDHWWQKADPICLIGQQATRVSTRLTQAYLDATQWIINQQASAAGIAKQILDVQNNITKTSTDIAAHTATLGDLLADNTAKAAVASAQQALDDAKSYAQTLDDLARSALAGITVPQPGQWNLHSVSVSINGKLLTTFVVDRRLKSHASSVVSYIHPLSPEDEFTFAVRANIPQEKSEHRPNSDEYAAGITTPFFKDNGISGWQSRPLSEAKVIGILRHKPSPGLDSFVSFDLQLLQIQARGRTYEMSQKEVPRFLRIEYANATDTRYLQWSTGTHLIIEGPVLWDTDQYGFYELHPVKNSQVQVANADDTLLGVPDLVTAFKKVNWWLVRTIAPRRKDGLETITRYSPLKKDD